ncbi:UNC-50, partial [Paraphysoderma sedebokerense]
MEFLYALDVHCNAYFPYILFTHVIQLFLLPVIYSKEGIISRIVANTLYALAGGVYVYEVWLGIAALPFLMHTEIFLYPLLIILIVYLVSLGTFNMSFVFLSWYFGH